MAKVSTKPLSGLNKFFILLIPLLIISLFAAIFTNIFITLVFCLLIALILSPVVDYLESIGINRSLSILIVYIIITSVLFLIYQLFVPNVVQEALSLKQYYKDFALSDKIKDLEKWLEKNLPFVKRGDIGRELETAIRGTYSKTQDILSGVVSTVLLVILIPVITFFILREQKKDKERTYKHCSQ